MLNKYSFIIRYHYTYIISIDVKIKLLEKLKKTFIIKKYDTIEKEERKEVRKVIKYSYTKPS